MSGPHKRWRGLSGLKSRLRRLLTPNRPPIFSSLDFPNEPLVAVEDRCAIAGWACSPVGIETIEVRIDGQRVRQFLPDGDRPDVAARLPGVPEAKGSGFDLSVPLGALPRGHHELQVLIRDKAGQEKSHFRTLDVVRDPYHAVLLAKQLSATERKTLKASLGSAAGAPRFELWVDGRMEGDLAATLRSITSQTYGCASHVVGGPDGATKSADPALAPEARWHASFAEAVPSNESLNQYVAFVTAGEQLMPDALLHVASVIVKTSPAIVYSDHDLVEATGRHIEPEHAPDWSPEHLLARNYVGGLFFVRRDELQKHAIHADRPGWRYDLLLRLTETTADIVHLPRVLWSEPAPTTRDNAGETAAVEAALARRNIPADVVPSADGRVRHVRRRLAATPRVSIIIPTTGRPDLLRTLMESLRRLTAYPNYELIFLNNGRGRHPEGIRFLLSEGLRVIERDETFNWARLSNAGARAADGDLLLFLNDDVEIVDPSWLDELVGLALEPGVGTVGAMLLYPDGLIQHAGIFLVDHGGGARHYLQFTDPAHGSPQDLGRVTREVTASTGACLMARRQLFEEAGGFNEEFQVAFNDADFCLRLSDRGYRNLWTPHCRLIHHESVSREGMDIGGDERLVWTRWGHRLLAGDPYHNPNLTKDGGDCSFDTTRAVRESTGDRSPAQSPGINLIGYIRAEMGLGEAARGLANALASSRVPFGIIDYEHGNPSRMADSSWTHRVVDQPLHDINVLCVTADLTPEALRRLGRSVAARRYTIGYWAWELGDFPERWRSRFDHVDEVWAPSEFVRKAVTGKSPVPVVRIPYCVEKSPGPYYARPFFELPEHAFLFLTMYDTHSRSERKNPEGAIAAFRDAFAPSDRSVGLVVKVNNADPVQARELRSLIGGHENIHPLDRAMTRYEVDSLLASTDCFVSLHRSEGFGLPMAEAMALGRPVIATNWSGNVDFMDETCAACVDYRLVRLTRSYGPYDAGQEWAEPNLDDAVRWMRTLRSDPETARRLGEAGRRRIRERLSAAVVGELVRARLADIVKVRGSR